jgi:glycerol-3-phosphate dehydrogenase
MLIIIIDSINQSGGTSSRSTKLIWAGSRYLILAVVSLLSTKLFKDPVKTVE